MVKKKIIKKISKSEIVGTPRFKQRAGFIQKLQPAPALGKEQAMIQEIFNGESTLGDGECLPKVEGILRRGGGIINNGDDYKETASMFGFGGRS